MTTIKASKVVSIPYFIIEQKDGTRDRLDFIPNTGVPGFTHRVAMNGKLTSRYLRQGVKPGNKVAVDMLECIADAEGLEKYRT